MKHCSFSPKFCKKSLAIKQGYEQIPIYERGMTWVNKVNEKLNS